MNEIRKITGYWGTYLPSDRLSPGMVGRVENGLFTREKSLAEYSGYNPSLHGPDKPQPGRNPVSVWQSKEIRMISAQGNADVPGEIAGGAIRVSFNKANAAVMICKGTRSQGLINLGEVRNLLHDLLEGGNWEPELCVVTEVRLVNAAWICFATSQDQEADIQASASVGLTGTPVDALTNAALKGSLSTSWSDKKSAGYSTEVTEGGTPLFQALCFKRTILGVGPRKLQFLRGADSAFEEPPFGEPAAQATSSGD
jgi:hypothetical protein